MKKPVKKEITVMLFSINDCIEGDLEDVIVRLQAYKSDEYKRQFIEKEYDYEHSYFVLYGIREETDTEFDKRLKEEAIIKAKQDKHKENRKKELIKEAKKLGLKVSE